MKKLLLLISLLSLGFANAQCGMAPVTLNERIHLADLVIEGQVVSQQTFEPDGSPMILTRNTIEITKVFKGDAVTLPNTIDIITKGGVLGLRADKITTALELFKNDKGIFTLQNYQNGTYQTIAGSQSFIRYSQPDYKAYSILKQWSTIDPILFNDITNITGVNYQSVNTIDFNYSPIIAKMGTPVINNVSPLQVNAGIGQVITIIGSGFGAVQGNGTVVFSNADDGGSISVVPDNTQIEFWSDTEIRVQVPTSAGNGAIAVVEDTGNNGISGQNLAVGFNHVNFTFGLSSGNAVAEVSLYNDNNAGGYDFDYSTGFVAEPDATATLDDIYEKWRCTTGVNFVRGADLAAGNAANTSNPQTAGADNINVVKFDINDLPANSTTLAFVLTRAAGCLVNGNDIVAFVSEMDVVINDDINWHYRDGGASSTTLDFNEFDFESVMLHEIGHAQQLGHVIDPSKVMHFSIGNGSTSRLIDEADVLGATYINDKSVVIAPCGQQPMEYADCDFVYANSSWTPFDPSGTFNPNSTLTAQNGTAPLTDIIGAKDITVDNGASLTAASGNEMIVTGDITNNGTASFNYISLQGETNQTLTGNTITIEELELSGTNTVNLNGPVDIITTFNNDGGSLNTNGNLTLKSTATGTAHVDVFEGTINGDVTVERYYPSRRAFRFISPSVTTTSSIFENWQENGAFVTGVGTHISGSTSGANGFDATISGNPSLFLYDNTGSNGWTTATSTNGAGDNLAAGNAYRLFVRGDRNPSLLTTVSSNETTVRATGTIATGNVSGAALSSTAGDFGFIGNPYQAPVDMQPVLTRAGSNLAPTYYVWDPNLSTNGAYVAINTVTNVSSNTGSPANKYAQPSQSFFVQTVANGAASINFTEADKDIDQGNVAVNNVYGSMRLSAILKNGTDNSLLDGFNIVFDPNFNNGITINDAQKLSNINESISVSQNGMNYSIAERELPVNQESLNLYHSNYRGTSYTYTILLSGSNLNAYLYDSYENVRHELVNNGSTDITFNVDQNNAASMAGDRFMIQFSNQTLSNLEQTSDLFKVYPNPSNGSFQINLNQSGDAQLDIYNMLGQKVHTADLSNNAIHQIETSLSSGNYILRVTQNGTSTTEKIIIQ